MIICLNYRQLDSTVTLTTCQSASGLQTLTISQNSGFLTFTVHDFDARKIHKCIQMSGCQPSLRTLINTIQPDFVESIKVIWLTD